MGDGRAMNNGPIGLRGSFGIRSDILSVELELGNLFIAVVHVPVQVKLLGAFSAQVLVFAANEARVFAV